MFDWIKNSRKSDSDKRQELITAYIDGQLSAAEARRFEQTMAQDAELKAAVADERSLKMALADLPRLRAPRNFTLNPADFPARQPAFVDQLYPKLKLATTIAAVLLVSVIALDLLRVGGPAAAPQASVASVPIVVTQVTTEGEVQRSAADSAPAEEAAAESVAAEAVVVEEPAAETMAQEAVSVEEAAEADLAIEAPPLPAATSTAEAALANSAAAPASADEVGAYAADEAAGSESGGLMLEATSPATDEATPALKQLEPEPQTEEALVTEAQATAAADIIAQSQAPESDVVEAPQSIPEGGAVMAEEPSFFDRLNLWRLVQASLALLTLALLIATLSLRRRQL